MIAASAKILSLAILDSYEQQFPRKRGNTKIYTALGDLTGLLILIMLGDAESKICCASMLSG